MDMEEDLSWLTQDSQNEIAQCRDPETAGFVWYVYDDEEYIDPVGNEVIIRQNLSNNDRVCLQQIQNGLIDNFDPCHPPILSLQSSAETSSQLSKQQTQRFSDPVTDDDLSAMQRKT